MRSRSSMTLLASVLAIAAGCAQHTQYSSGADYIARYQNPVAASPAGGNVAPRIDAAIVQAASVEPDLRFPGRFGLARIVNGALSPVPEREAALWREFAGGIQDLGEFVPISPMVAEMSYRGAERDRRYWSPSVGYTVEMIRVGAARQHIDAVLIYEVGARSSSANTVFALADITLIGGAFLPTREITAEGRASALFVDVRNGYPYGTASAAVDLSTYFVSWGSDRKTDQKRDEAIRKVVEKLIPEVETMIGDLKDKAGRTPRKL